MVMISPKLLVMVYLMNLTMLSKMMRPLRKSDANIFNKSFTFHVLFFGFVMGICTLITQAFSIHYYESH